MQPTAFQRLFTDDKPLYFIMASGAVAMLAFAGSVLVSTVTASIWSIIQFIVLMSVAACLGAMLGTFPGEILLGIFLRWIEHRNGAPFHEGDEVIILSKRFPGRITRVYEVWAERHQVRVELDEAARRQVTDVYSYLDVCRRPAVE